MVSRDRGWLFAAEQRPAARVVRHAVFHLPVLRGDGARAASARMGRANNASTGDTFAGRFAVVTHPDGGGLAAVAFGRNGSFGFRCLRFRRWLGCGTVPVLWARSGDGGGGENAAHDDSKCASNESPLSFPMSPVAMDC